MSEDNPDVKRMRPTGFSSSPVRKLKIKKKVYPSVAQYPTVDFRALLETAREKIEHETLVALSMRGKGSGHEDDKEMLHVLIEAESEDQAHKAERMVRDVLNDPSKLPPPVQTEMVLRQSIFGGPRPPRDFQQTRQGEFYKEVRVPESVAGGIIGRAGETVKRMQQETNTRIHINREGGAYDDGTRVIVVRGATQEDVDACERMILDFAQSRSSQPREVVASSAPTTSDPDAARARHPSPPLTSQPGRSLTDYHKVPNHRAGAVIGRQGATIKALQLKYHARIVVPPGADPTNPNERTVVISADTPQIVSLIKQEIDTIVEGKSTYVGAPDDYVETVKIPDDKAGLVIGKQGATIKSIQDRLKVRIQIPSQADGDPNDVVPMRTASVIGKRDLVQLAIREIEAVVNGEIYAGTVANATVETTVSTSVMTTEGAYAKQWEDYFNQINSLPPDQRQIALEALKEHQRSLGMQ